MKPADTSATGVFQVALPVPLAQLFDYLPPQDGPGPQPGSRVQVRLGAQRLYGVVVGRQTQSQVPAARLRPIETVLADEPPLPAELLALLRWCWSYYHHPPGEVVATALPPLLRSGPAVVQETPTWLTLTEVGRAMRVDELPANARRQRQVLGHLAAGPAAYADLRAVMANAATVVRTLENKGWVARTAPPDRPARLSRRHRLREEQSAAVDAMAAADGFQGFVLDGITGSGKTEVYLQAIARVLTAGGQVLLLVPEIGLTPQLVRRVRERLGIEPVTYHSGLSPKARLAAYRRAAGPEPLLVLGTRSAVFLPLPRLALTVVDEEHDSSFKQEDGFRYSARDVAVKRAAMTASPIVLGSATPSLESLHNCDTGRYRRLHLRQRPEGVVPPAWRVVDMRQQPLDAGLSPILLQRLDETLAAEQQALLFLNRRGFAPIILCSECGWQADCVNCDAHLTVHRPRDQLRCHHCGARRELPRRCPDCGGLRLTTLGQGTQQLEQTLTQRYPQIPVVRVDRDRVRGRHQLEQALDILRAGTPAILLGTQMIAKGHHFPRLTLAALVNVDQALFSADFRAMERAGQMIMQVAGRAGRGQQRGEVLLQTYQPAHPLLKQLVGSDYETFATALLAERKAASWPPYSHLSLLRADAPEGAVAEDFLTRARALAGNRRGQTLGVSVAGPFAALMERRAGRYRHQLLLQSSRRTDLHAFLNQWLPRVRELKTGAGLRWSMDVDPVSL